MKLITNIYKSNNDNIVFFLFLFAALNQIKVFLTDYIFYYYIYSFIFFSYLISIFYKKKIQINYIKNYFSLIIIILLFFLEFIVYDNKFDLKISIFLSIVVFSSFLVSEFNEKKFFLYIIYFSLLFLLVGTYGWLTGGEGGSWGNQFIYFGYQYLPSTRNENVQIFLYGFLFSLFYIFYYKLDWKILTINLLNLLALILSFSRGIFILIPINFMLFGILIIFKQNNKIKHFLYYLLISLIFTYSSFQIINNSVKIDLNSTFETKLQSLYAFSFKNNTETQIEYKNLKKDVSSEKRSHLYKTSLNSLNLKFNDWKSFFINANKTIFENFIYKNDKKNYRESSILYALSELNIIIFVLLSYFIISQIYKIFKNDKSIEKKIFFSIILINFIFLNLIYNYFDDIWNYLILFYLILSSQKQTGNF